MARTPPKPRAGAKASSDKPINYDYYLYRVHRLRIKTTGDPLRESELSDMRAVGLLLIEGWISA